MERKEYIDRVAQFFVQRVKDGGAIWQKDVRDSLQSMPLAFSGERHVPLMGGNGLLLAQLMLERGWHDPRFMTREQVDEIGGVVLPDSRGVPIQYLKSVGDDGLVLERPELVSFSVFNGEQVQGLAKWQGGRQEFSLELLAMKLPPVFGLEIVHDQKENSFFSSEDGKVHMPPMNAFPSVAEYASVAIRELIRASRNEVELEVGQNDRGEGIQDARGALRAVLASMHLNIALGLPFGIFGGAVKQGELVELLEQHPGELFSAARDAEKMAAVVLWNVRAVEMEGNVHNENMEGKLLSSRDNAMNKGRVEYLAWVEGLFESRQAILAVPFAQKDEAAHLGAVFYPERKVWFVPEGVDLGKFKKWAVTEKVQENRPPTKDQMLREFADVIVRMGLVLKGDETIVADGKWHYVSVDRAKANKAGAYALHLDDARPHGTVINRYSGEKEVWMADMPRLSVDELARMRREALMREELATKELNARYELMSGIAQGVWFLGVKKKQGYCARKQVGNHGARVVSGEMLLSNSGFMSEDGKTAIKKHEDYLIIPLHDEHGKIWSLQAISGDGKTKMFMSGARKKGAFFVMNDEGGFGALPESGKVAFVEGFATGASLHEATGWPVVVCFDAGGVEAVAQKLAPLLAPSVVPVFAADNDQFFVEKVLGFLARTGVDVKKNEGAMVKVAAGGDRVRDVSMGEVVADGEWHQSTVGRYKVVLEKDVNYEGCVGKVSAEILIDARREVLTIGNRGVEAARKAASMIPGAEVIVPAFESLKGRPTDWNDLGVREGYDILKLRAGLNPPAISKCQMLDER